MTTKLITYQLENNSDYSIIREKLKSFPKWAKLMDRSWLIKSEKSASEIRSILSEAINSKGKIFVIDLDTNSWGTYAVDQTVTKWMKENISK